MKRQLFFTAATLALVGSWHGVYAQRGAPTRDERRAQRQQDTANMSPEERQQYFQQRMADRLKNMTPEQQQQWQERRQQMQDQMRAQGIDPNDPNAWQQMRGNRNGQNGANRDQTRRQLMLAAGITDTVVQDAIIAFLNDQETARQPLLALAKAAASSLKTTTNPVVEVAANTDNTTVPTDAATPAVPTEQDIAAAFEKYQSAVVQDRVRYAEALKTLDQKINYSTNARLKSFLTLAGILDYDALALGGISAILMPTLNPQPTAPNPNLQTQLPNGVGIPAGDNAASQAAPPPDGA